MTGIHETVASFTDMDVSIFDCGPSRYDRRNWIRSFNGVSLVIFTVALSDYDLVLEEDETVVCFDGKQFSPLSLFPTSSPVHFV